MKSNMKAIYLTFVFGAVLSACSNGQQSSDSVDVETNKSSTEIIEFLEFDVNFPETEYKIQKKITNPANMPTVTNYLLEGKDENGPFMYFVSFNEMPKDFEGLVEDPDLLNVAFKGMLTGSAEKLGGFDYEYSEIKYAEHPGMSLKCKVFNGEGMIKSKVYLIQTKLYIVSGGGKNIDKEILDNFLKSFKLKD